MAVSPKKFGKNDLKLPTQFSAKGFDRLDQRRAVVKRMNRRFKELLSQTGRNDTLTILRCKRAAYLELAVESHEVRSLETGDPAGGVYVQQLQLLERVYGELGIEVDAVEVPDLEAHLETLR